MTEERKHAILFATTLLSARRLRQYLEVSIPKDLCGAVRCGFLLPIVPQ